MAALQHGCQDVDALGSVLPSGVAEFGGQLAQMAILDDVTAVAELDTRLRAARPDDNRIARDPDAAVRLAGACGGLPSALRVAAALLRADPILTADDLVDELDAVWLRLRGTQGGEDAGSWTSEVVAVFELAYGQLSEPQARVFRLLPVHPTPDVSVRAVVALADRSTDEVCKTLLALAQANLVEAVPGSTDRWRLPQMVRLYAQFWSNGLARADMREQAWDRLLDYYLTTAEAADDQLRRRPDLANPAAFSTLADGLAWLEAERPNLVAAVGMAADTGRDCAAASLPLYLAQYLARQQLYDDLLAVTTIGLSAARRLGDWDLQGSSLTNIGFAQQEQGRAEEAISAHGDAIAIFQMAGDMSGMGDALNNLGLALGEENRPEEAIAAHRDAVVIYREIGDRPSEAAALNNLGLALKRAGRIDEAINSHESAAVIYQETGDRNGEAMALGNLGGILQLSGCSDAAINAWRGAAARFLETGDHSARGVALSNLGSALAEVGRSEDAIIAYKEAASVFRDVGDEAREMMALARVQAEYG
jgi:tetratricopeptide (TPR) repeat protein